MAIHYIPVVKQIWKKINNDSSLYLNETNIERSHEVVLLGVTIGKELNFKKHIKNICHLSKYKLHALQQIRRYLNTEKA